MFGRVVSGMDVVRRIWGGDNCRAANVEAAAHRANFPFDGIEAGADFFQLAIAPGRMLLLGRPHRFLVARQYGGGGNAIADRLFAQRPPARRSGGGEKPVAAGFGIEPLANHPAVEQGAAVVQHQGRDLAQRVGRQNIGIAVDRVGGGGDGFNAVGQAQFVGHDHDLAYEGRGGGVEQLHGGFLSGAFMNAP